MYKRFLYEDIEQYSIYCDLKEIPEVITANLSSKIILRDYQKKAFSSFITYCEENELKKNKKIHNLFHMATGSGKTVIMAGLILYLYTKGYRKFLFFVNQTNILEKTIDNFINQKSNKYLFSDTISYLGNKISIKKVNKFSDNILKDDIEIVFTTTQKLHLDLFEIKENSLTYNDFENDKIVFISDESHHINSSTKKSDEEIISWENSVMKAFECNKDNVMLEFTATCDLKDKNVELKYKDKIVFDYPLISFRESGYTKDFQNFATDTDFWTRTLIALVMSEYRKFLFSDLKLNIKPVVMLKSKTKPGSEKFYNEFFEKIKNLSTLELEKLKLVGVDTLLEAINYFEEKDKSLELLEQSIKLSFTEDTSILINSDTTTKEKQLQLNSLEDLDNPIRLIFAVDMLNEGWDVLNLFDIVRLYDERQGSGKAGKVGNYTIKEAQLIGRGARYCPFVIDDEEYKFKRKYDADITNKNRILETMYFHSKNDSKYISELKAALIETGLQAENTIKVNYILKSDFKDTDFYKNSLVFSNKRELKSREEVDGLENSMRNKTYYWKVLSKKGSINSLVEIDKEKKSDDKKEIKTYKFKEIDMNILMGAMDYFNKELNFKLLKEKYPKLTSKREFLTSNKFLGNVRIEIEYFDKNLSGKNLFEAVKYVLSKIATHVISLKPEYIGTREFSPKNLKYILKDKVINLSKIEKNDGKGVSQNSTRSEEYRLDLSKEDWYVFNDNYGTSEEKAFIKYFKTNIVPKLKGLEFYVVRNERISELAIYSFENGERFEPDFLLFVKKKNFDENTVYQAYIEPKGSHLLSEDKWKEDFLEEIGSKHITSGLFAKDYKIIGLPFFNREKNIEKFEKEIEEFLKTI